MCNDRNHDRLSEDLDRLQSDRLQAYETLPLEKLTDTSKSLDEIITTHMKELEDAKLERHNEVAKITQVNQDLARRITGWQEEVRQLLEENKTLRYQLAAMRAVSTGNLPTPEPTFLEVRVANSVDPVRGIIEERIRQVTKLPYSTSHDFIVNSNEELAAAAASYLIPFDFREGMEEFPTLWPWDSQYWKPKVTCSETNTIDNRLRELDKAGALLIAEKERLMEKRRVASHV